MNLEKSIGIEVYIVVEDESVKTEVEIHDNYTDMLEYLTLLGPEEHSTTKVYHGILMPAKVLPSSLKGKNCYILALEMTNQGGIVSLEGYVYESDCEGDVNLLADEIEKLINSNEYAASIDVTIDNVFLLYGYEMETCISINPDSMDEEVIDTCEKIVKEISQVKLDKEESEYEQQKENYNRNYLH